jgi:hypothetical protein
MAGQRWRRARDLAKELWKKDKARYVVLLMESNAGLYREFKAKGAASDAQNVLNYLKTIAPADFCTALAAQPVKAPSGKAPSGMAHIKVDWVVVKDVARALAAGLPVSASSWAAVDALVVSAEMPVAADEEDEKILAELIMVRTAVAATGEGTWEEAQTALRNLPRQSVFQHWRLFLRGVRSFYQGEKDSAVQCFAQLPTGGALARAATEFGGAGELRPPETARVALQLAQTRQPVEWAVPIVAAAQQYRQRKFEPTIQALKEGLGKEFPSLSPGLPGALSDLLYPRTHRLSDRQIELVNQMERVLERKNHQRIMPPESEAMLSFRTICFAFSAEMPAADLAESWSIYLGILHKIFDKNPLCDSTALLWLAGRLAEPERSRSFFDFRGPAPKNLEGAKAAYTKALEFDPSNESAATAFIAFLDRYNDKPARNRLLDQCVERFPKNPQLLAMAGARAVERKALDKGIKYLREAAALDPLNQGIRRDLVKGLLLSVQAGSKKGKPTTALWDELDGFARTGTAADPSLAPWLLRLRRHLWEGCQRSGEEARKLAPSPLEHFIVHTALSGIYAVDLPDSPPALGEGMTLLNLIQALITLDGFTTVPEWKVTSSNKLATYASHVLKILLPQAVANEPDHVVAAARYVMAGLHRRETEDSPLNCLPFETLQDWRDDLLMAIFGNPKGRRQTIYLLDLPRTADPRLRFAVLMLQISTTAYVTPAVEKIWELRDVAKAARAGGFPQLAAEVERKLATLPEAPEEPVNRGASKTNGLNPFEAPPKPKPAPKPKGPKKKPLIQPDLF